MSTQLDTVEEWLRNVANVGRPEHMAAARVLLEAFDISPPREPIGVYSGRQTGMSTFAARGFAKTTEILHAAFAAAKAGEATRIAGVDGHDVVVARAAPHDVGALPGGKTLSQLGEELLDYLGIARSGDARQALRKFESFVRVDERAEASSAGAHEREDALKIVRAVRKVIESNYLGSARLVLDDAIERWTASPDSTSAEMGDVDP